MGHKRIELENCFEGNNVNNRASAQENNSEIIPIAAVQGNAELQVLNAERQKAQEQLQKTVAMTQCIVKSVQDAEANIVASCNSLCEQLSAQSDSCVSRLNSHSDAITEKFEGDCNKICNIP